MSTDSSRVPKPIEQLVEVFETHLGEVTFPGVTAATLREQADALAEASQRLEDAQAELERAQAAHSDAMGTLQTAAHRGLGYARVFGADDPELTQALKSISLSSKTKGAKRLPPKKRARPSKGRVDNVAKLPVQGSA